MLTRAIAECNCVAAATWTLHRGQQSVKWHFSREGLLFWQLHNLPICTRDNQTQLKAHAVCSSVTQSSIQHPTFLNITQASSGRNQPKSPRSSKACCLVYCASPSIKRSAKLTKTVANTTRDSASLHFCTSKGMCCQNITSAFYRQYTPDRW